MATPVSIAIDSTGRYAMGAPIGGGNETAVKCGMPSLMRSADGAAWTHMRSEHTRVLRRCRSRRARHDGWE